MASHKTFSIVAEPEMDSILLKGRTFFGSTELFVSTTSGDLIDLYTCEESCNQTYLTTFIPGALQALSIASKASIRINLHGILSLQMIIPYRSSSVFLEYLVAPLVSVEADNP